MNEAIDLTNFRPAPIVDHLQVVEDDLKEDKAPLPHYSADRDEFMEKLNPAFTFPTWDTVERDEEHKKLMLTDVIDLN